ncbi:MAG: type II toxin-antitoxin system VapC family toxin, partial [Planctomycetota bacterium]
IWAVADPEQLSVDTRKLLSETETSVFFSPISSAEIACLAERGKVEFDRHWKLWFNHFTSLNKWKGLDITLDIIQEAYSLPGEFHKDPADRIIVATARKHDLIVVTGDNRITQYPHINSCS